MCLASRFPYGEKIKKEKLYRLGQAEFEIGKLGFIQFRIRSHENLARIEFIPSEMNIPWDIRNQIEEICLKSGFSYVAFDLKGYRTGSMNEVLNDSVKSVYHFL